MNRLVKFYDYDTKKISTETLKRMVKPQPKSGTASLNDQRELVLVVRGIIERLVFPDSNTLTLGRGAAENHVDLTAYGALDRGVSRTHAKLHIEGDYLYLTDLGSMNGTYLAGQRLKAHTPTLVHKEDDIILGSLPIKIMFR